MIRSLTYKIVLISILLLCHTNGISQKDVDAFELDKRIDNYLELVNLGYTDNEIFHDLGNVNFLTKNYEAAAFWYEKLLSNDQSETINERYQFVLQQLNGKQQKPSSKDGDWLASVKADYLKSIVKPDHESKSQASKPQSTIAVKNHEFGQDYAPIMTTTQDGKVAYFSKGVYKKPLYGLFSKKELIHEIYRAEMIDGQWQNIKKVVVCPEYFSATHPTVSSDGKRLFFASNMPGTFGEYDIYVADLNADGSAGIAKNLGPKVNTKKNDLYPNLYNGTLLFFASEGHDGFGGLDLYAAQVTENQLSSSINLGDHINSNSDEYAIQLRPEEKMGYVMSNRGGNASAQEFAISYSKKKDHSMLAKNEEKLMKLLNDDSQIEYSTTVFEDDE